VVQFDAHDLSEHTQVVVTEDQADVSLAEAASEKRCGEVGKVSRRVQIFDVDARVEALARQVCVARVEVVVNVGDEVRTDSDVLDADDLDRVLVMVDDPVDRRVFLIDEAGEQGDADYPAGCRDARSCSSVRLRW
jgi:hypothetical protein